MLKLKHSIKKDKRDKRDTHTKRNIIYELHPCMSWVVLKYK